MSFRDFVLLAAVCFVWGLNLVVTRWVVADAGVPPVFFAGMRFAGIALVLFWFGLVCGAIEPGKQAEIRRLEAMPDLLDLGDSDASRLRGSNLRQPRRDANPHSASDQFQQRPASA